jgi:hypothetical protein
MSYDVAFLLPKTVQWKDVESYFSARKHYSLLEKTIDFENENTEVSFTVNTMEGGKEFGTPEILDRCVVFNINFFRPNFYGASVAEELAAFSAVFSKKFYNEFTGEIENFSSTLFLDTWAKANAGFVKKLSLEGGYDNHFAANALVENCYTWNRIRTQIEEKNGNETYAAKIMWFKENKTEKIFTAANWPDQIPILIPKFCERVIVYRTQVQNTGWLQKLKNVEPTEEKFLTLFDLKELVDQDVFQEIEVEGFQSYLHSGDTNAAIQSIFQRSNIPFDLFVKEHPKQSAMAIFEDVLAPRSPL